MWGGVSYNFKYLVNYFLEIMIEMYYLEREKRLNFKDMKILLNSYFLY